jgi:hypothetical protein
VRNLKNSKIIIPIIILLAVVFGVGGFFAGRKYQQSKQPAFLREFGRGQGTRVEQGNRQGLRPVNGDIISADEKSITVKMQDGSSKIVLISEKTEINKATEATNEDLKVGEKVAVFGTENSDGSVTAQSIQLNPEFRGGPVPTQAQ